MKNAIVVLVARVVGAYLLITNIIGILAYTVSALLIASRVHQVDLALSLVSMVVPSALVSAWNILLGIILWFSAEKIGNWAKDIPDKQETLADRGEKEYLQAGIVVTGVIVILYSLPPLITSIIEVTWENITHSAKIMSSMQVAGLGNQLSVVVIRGITELTLGFLLIFYSQWIINRLWAKNNIIREISPVEPESD